MFLGLEDILAFLLTKTPYLEEWHVKLLFDDDSIMWTTDACEEKKKSRRVLA